MLVFYAGDERVDKSDRFKLWVQIWILKSVQTMEKHQLRLLYVNGALFALKKGV